MTTQHLTLGDIKPELFSGRRALEEALGYRFVKDCWLFEALTHRSALVSEGFDDQQLKDERPWNERLEFLGDSVLSLVITEHLIHSSRTLSEGDMSRIRASLVCEESLAHLARKLNLGRVLVLGNSELRSAGHNKTSLLADAFEAVIGAVFSDGGWPAAKKLVLHLFKDLLTQDRTTLIERDHKTAFQELMQERFRATPTYDVLGESGPAHARLFEVAVYVDKDGIREEWGRGSGSTKKRAAQIAAAHALERMKECHS